jgi:hypothetical protein
MIDSSKYYNKYLKYKKKYLQQQGGVESVMPSEENYICLYDDSNPTRCTHKIVFNENTLQINEKLLDKIKKKELLEKIKNDDILECKTDVPVILKIIRDEIIQYLKNKKNEETEPGLYTHTVNVKIENIDGLNDDIESIINEFLPVHNELNTELQSRLICSFSQQIKFSGLKNNKIIITKTRLDTDGVMNVNDVIEKINKMDKESYKTFIYIPPKDCNFTYNDEEKDISFVLSKISESIIQNNKDNKLLVDLSNVNFKESKIPDKFCERVECMETIILPASVESIGKNFCYGCKSLKNITFSKESSLEKIDKSFCSNTSLEELILPTSVKSIAEEFCSECTSLKKITFLKGSNLKQICKFFCYNSSLETLELPASLESIGQRFCNNCTSLKNITFFGVNLKRICQWFCYSCYSLEKLSLPGTVECIGAYFCNNCNSLKNITLGSNLNNIDQTFCRNTSLEELTLPASIKYIGDEFCNYCKSLKNIKFLNRVTSIRDICVIGTYFCSNSSLEKLELPAYVESIGDHFCYDCKSLKNITFPKQSRLKNIGHSFCYSTRLEELILPAYVESIGDYFCYECESLKNITFPKESSLKNIGHSFCYGCKNLKVLVLGSTGKLICTNWFTFCNDCGNLEIVIFPKDFVFDQSKYKLQLIHSVYEKAYSFSEGEQIKNIMTGKLLQLEQK